jgi:SAM-dependent methyltransferase
MVESLFNVNLSQGDKFLVLGYADSINQMHDMITNGLIVDGLDIKPSDEMETWLNETDSISISNKLNRRFVKGDASIPLSYEPFEDSTYDYVLHDRLSHCLRDGSESTVFEQSYHKLKPGGHLCINDIALTKSNIEILSRNRKILNESEMENSDGTYFRAIDGDTLLKKLIYLGYSIDRYSLTNTEGIDMIQIFARKGHL